MQKKKKSVRSKKNYLMIIFHVLAYSMYCTVRSLYIIIIMTVIPNYSKPVPWSWIFPFFYIHVVNSCLLVSVNFLISYYLVSETGKFFYTHSKSQILWLLLESTLFFFKHIIVVFFAPQVILFYYYLTIFLPNSGNNIFVSPNISNLLLKLFCFSYDSLINNICR